jgi:hypothetical protein
MLHALASCGTAIGTADTRLQHGWLAAATLPLPPGDDAGHQVLPHRRLAPVVHGFHLQAVELVQFRHGDVRVRSRRVGAEADSLLLAARSRRTPSGW